MTDGHCFISYSAADGLDFATNLADELQGRHPNIHVWFDKREMDASIVDWDDQLANAIKACKCLVFVMTPDSVAKGSTCKEEWTWALKYKKPVICLVKDKKAEVPFRLNNRQYIDISTDFESGIAQLRTAIKRLDEPEGILEELDRRLSQAKRDLQRTPHEEEKPRIQAEIEELNKQIEAQQKVVANPKKAEEQTQKNIEAGLERERQPEKPVAGKTSTRFINPPPGIAPNYFQDRLIETKQITDFLNNDSQRLMTIVGRAGVGKTAMVCRLLKALERGELPDDLGEMKVDGIVYLSETGSHRVNFANVFADLSKLLPKDDAERLEGIYKNPQTSTGDKMRALLDAFPSGRVILLLDNFESLFDPESQNPRDSELSEVLNALLGGQHHAVKAVITTRIAPHDLAVSEPGRQRHLRLDEGLESPYAENVLREIDTDGRVGLKTAPDALLNKAREKTRGFPKALVAIYGILSVDRYTTLEELLDLPILPENVVEAYVGEAFNRLDPSAQKVMQALAVYNRPVSPAAIDYLLQPHLPSIDSALVLNRLVNMHFARREAGRYYLHPADKEYAFSIIPVEKDLTTKDTKVTKDFEEEDSVIKVESDDVIPASKTDDENAKRERLAKELKVLIAGMKKREEHELGAFTQNSLLKRAANYYKKARKPRGEWKKLDDLAAQLAEFELRCAAGDYDTAASVLLEFDWDYLLLWGHYRLMIELQENLQEKINDKELARISVGNLGLANLQIGKVQLAITYEEKALQLAREMKNRRSESAWFGNLGNAYADLGDTSKAIEFHEQALVIDREIGDRRGESADLGNLGNAYGAFGDARKAIEFHEQALVIAREVRDRTTEGAELSNIAGQYLSLAEYDKAINYYNQALQNAREIGNKYGESKRLNGLAGVLIDKGDLLNAIKNAQESLQIGQEISSPEVCIESSNTLAMTFLLSENLKDALQVVENARKYDQPHYNFNITVLHGIITLRQGERETAQEAFAKSIAQADEILVKTPDYYSALDAKGLALSGLALCEVGDDDRRRTVDDGQSSMVYRQQAIDAFKQARKIAPHAGVVKSVLRLFDELVKCDEEGVLKDVRKAAEGIS